MHHTKPSHPSHVNRRVHVIGLSVVRSVLIAIGGLIPARRSMSLLKRLTKALPWAVGQIRRWVPARPRAEPSQAHGALIAALQQREHDLEVIFNSAPTMMIVVDAQRRVRRANRAAIEATGSPESHLVSLRGGEALNCLNAAHGCGFSPQCAHCQVRQTINETFRTCQNSYKRPARLPLPIGMRDLLISTTLLAERDEPLALVIIDDETERRQVVAALQERNQQLAQALVDLTDAQQRLIHHEQMSAVGQVAAGIAHDFNNILTGIRATAELAQLDPQTAPALQDDLSQIIRSSDRATSIVRQLLDVRRASPRPLPIINVVPLLRETELLLAHMITLPVSVMWDLAPGAHMLRANPTQIQQVLINLALNARDAMPTGGELWITLTSHQIAAQVGAGAEDHLPGGAWVCLQVRDTGTGIEPTALPRIFEPFFTTKALGAGTGLGLSQVADIVRQHAGRIEVMSERGWGTRFTIYLPLHDPQGGPSGPMRRLQRRAEPLLTAERDIALCAER
jgi:signal transduction histidine kinase